MPIITEIQCSVTDVLDVIFHRKKIQFEMNVKNGTGCISMLFQIESGSMKYSVPLNI